MRHNEVMAELPNLCGKAYSPAAVRDEPTINLGPSAKKDSPAAEKDIATEQADRRDLLIRGLWNRGRHCVIDIRVTDLNNASQRG